LAHGCITCSPVRVLRDWAEEEEGRSAAGFLRATPGGPDEDDTQNETDDAEDNPPSQIRSGRREKPAAPDDTTDSRSIHEFFSDFPHDRVACVGSPAHAEPQESRMN
jgi:hypothetical protein